MFKVINYIVLGLLIFMFSTSELFSQITDNIVWSSIKVQKNLNPKTSFAIAPIFRFHEDISTYQNMSVDVSAKRKLGKGWSAEILSRTWFIPDQKSRQFLWLDIGYQKKLGILQASSRIRLHYALDINDRNDPDFIRWKTMLMLLNQGKITPFVSIEPWFRLNDGGEFQRIRYEPGVKLDIIDDLNLTMVYRREVSANLEPGSKFNVYVITLAYTLPDRKGE